MRVIRSFAFLDLYGFTRYTELNGDTAAVAVLTHLRSTLRAQAERHGVRVTKWLGDGAMLSGLDCAGVAACSLGVIEEIAEAGSLPLRGGLAEGPVVMFEGDDYIGAAVNDAARLCSAAGAGELLVDRLAVARLPPHERLVVARDRRLSPQRELVAASLLRRRSA
jgi:class 3 adenylate cyclase